MRHKNLPRQRATLLLVAVVALALCLGLSTSFEAAGAAEAGTAAKKGKRCSKSKGKPSKGKAEKNLKRGGCKKKPATPQSPAPAVTPPLGPAPPTPGAPGILSLEADPELFPEFDPGVSDYVVRCDDDPVTVEGVAAPDSSVLVDGEAAALSAGAFDAEVELDASEAFTVEATGAGAPRRYHVRCLPTDFPAWDFERFGQPASDLYVVAPSRRVPVGATPYVVIFDDNGVPLWWYGAPVSLADAKVLPGGIVAWARGDSTGYELRRLNGSLIRTVSFVGAATGEHELQPIGDNFLVMTYKTRGTTEDLSFCPGGAPNQSVQDSAIQEIDASGNVVWSWNSKDHIGLDEITPRWCPSVITGSHDTVHLNSIEPNGDSIVVSLRRTDAVYSISRATGEVEWKLGGTTIPESLTPVSDPSGADPLAGQHDARILSDGTLTVHDNATNSADARMARAVRYQLDEVARTATLLEAVTDPDLAASPVGCCGSARRAITGDWLMSWGQVSRVTEFAPNGDRNFRLGFGPATTAPFSYRAVPVPAGELDPATLRAGMSARFPG